MGIELKFEELKGNDLPGEVMVVGKGLPKGRMIDSDVLKTLIRIPEKGATLEDLGVPQSYIDDLSSRSLITTAHGRPREEPPLYVVTKAAQESTYRL